MGVEEAWRTHVRQAAADDAVFGRLGTELARLLKARSAVIHWHGPDALAQEVSYSGYFSPSHMENYSRYFESDDLWSKAVKGPGRLNQLWNCSDLIPDDVYAQSRIYNEWIRPMGDDTFYCLGGTIKRNGLSLDIGVHRGRSQPCFNREELRLLMSTVDELAWLASVRCKLHLAERTASLASAAAGVLGYAIFTVESDGMLAFHNAEAGVLAQLNDGLSICNGRLVASDRRASEAVMSVIKDAAESPKVVATAVRVPRATGGSYELSVVSGGAEARQKAHVIVSSNAGADLSIQTRLRELFGLSCAEAEVAALLAKGFSPGDLAEQRSTTIGTARAQVKAVLSKLGCRRQSEAAAVVAALPRLNLLLRR